MRVPGRSAIEQQVTSEAVRAAVDGLELGSLQRVPYQVRVSAAADVDREWVTVCVRDRLVAEGHTVLAKVGPVLDPTHVIDLTVSHAATDLEATLIGIPLFVPGVPVAFGDLSLYKSDTITGRARLGAHIFDPGGRLVATVDEVQRSRFFRNETFLTFIGAFIRSNISDFVEPGEEEKPQEEDPTRDHS